MSSSISTSTIVFATVGTVATGLVAYAVYFDYKRRHDVEFRKSLKREAKKQAKAAKVEEEQQGKKKRQEVRELVDESNEDGYPAGAEDREAYFMTQVGEGEQMVQDSMFSCLWRDELVLIESHQVPRRLKLLYASSRR